MHIAYSTAAYINHGTCSARRCFRLWTSFFFCIAARMYIYIDRTSNAPYTMEYHHLKPRFNTAAYDPKRISFVYVLSQNEGKGP